MGRKQKEVNPLQFHTISMVYNTSIEKEWLSLIAGCAEQEIRKRLKNEGEERL
jgi:hypothetical protein